MISLYLFRHGESEMNLHPELVGGRSNWAKLTQKGQNQAKALGRRLNKENICFHHVFASPAERTKATARIACAEIGFAEKKIVVTPEIQELNQGEWEGKVRAECYTPEVMNTLKEAGWNFRAPGGESRKEVEDRMVRFLKESVLTNNKKGENLSIGIFGHGVSLKCLLRNILDFDQSMAYKVLLSNTSITELRFDDEDGWFIERINDGAHISIAEDEKALANWLYGGNE